MIIHGYIFVFWEKVRLYRLEKKLSQEELALLCGLHRTYVGSVERGERNITLVNAHKISIALDIPLSDFLWNKYGFGINFKGISIIF